MKLRIALSSNPSVKSLIPKAGDEGHGHVTPRADGMRAKCGALRSCSTCQAEKAALDKSPRDDSDFL